MDFDVQELPRINLTCWQASKILTGIGDDPELAGKVGIEMERAGWTIVEYNWDGDIVYAPPKRS